jgi:uncharacterized membrane protein
MGHKHKSRHHPNLPTQPIPSQNSPVSLRSVQIEQYQGPLPHPNILHEYDTVIPGSAERIIHQFEEQAKHRQDLERAVIHSDIRDGRTGLFLGFIIGIVAIMAGTYCIAQGHSVAGGIVGGSAVPSLTAVFVYGSRQRRKEREAKQQQATKK